MESQNSHRAKIVLRNKNSVQEPPCLTSYYSNTKKKKQQDIQKTDILISGVELRIPVQFHAMTATDFFLSFKLKQSLILLYVYVCIHECAQVYHMCTQTQQKSKEDIGSHETGITCTCIGILETEFQSDTSTASTPIC